MNKEKWKQQRQALMDEAQQLLAEGDTEKANEKMAEVETLDNQYEEFKKANANFNALNSELKVITLENESLSIKGGLSMSILGTEPIKDEKEIYLNAWSNFVQGKKLDSKQQEIFDKVNTEFNNSYTHDTGNTSILIPETVVTGIWKRAEEMYPLLADVKKYNVKGTLTIKKHTGITAGDATWYDEDTSTADEQNAFGELTLTGCELAKSITVSWKLRSMATEEFIPFIINELGERVGAILGKSISVGKGKPGTNDTFKAQPQGIETALLAEPNTPQVVFYNPSDNPADPLTYADFTSAIGKIHSSYLPGTAIYANSKTIWNQLANLTDTTGRPLFIPDATSGGVGRMFGMVVKADAGVTEGSIIIGNPAQGYVMNTNEPMSIATEEHAKARTVDYVAYTIVDGAVLDTKAFALLKKSA